MIIYVESGEKTSLRYFLRYYENNKTAAPDMFRKLLFY